MVKSRRKKHISAIFFLLVINLTFFSAENYPHITELVSRNPVFKQYNQEVEQNYKNLARGKPVLFSVYTYTCTKDDTIITLSARCNIPQETIATLNHIPSADSVIAGKTLFLPTVTGLFITKSPSTTLEYILSKKNFDYDSTLCYSINGDSFYFLPDCRFESTERAFFLDTSLISPLPEGILTSSYGMRISPITGVEQFHNGVDLAAPVGTAVSAARAGVVRLTGNDRVYGNYIIIKHDNNTESLYGHLSAILVKKGQTVEKGAVIGKVGTTGLSTGPHLHFEIRMDGKSQTPPAYLFFNKE